jgi:MFS superfamily sulfate permease-like transporter
MEKATKKALIYIIILGFVCTLVGVAIGITVAKGCTFKRITKLPKAIAAYKAHKRDMALSQEQRLEKKTNMFLKRIDEELNLSDEQKEAVRVILEQAKENTAQIQSEFKDKLLQIKQEASIKISELLNPEQKEKFQQFTDKQFKKK